MANTSVPNCVAADIWKLLRHSRIVFIRANVTLVYGYVLICWGLNKLTDILMWTFANTFSSEYLTNLITKIAENVIWGHDRQKVNIILYNDQAIALTDEDQFDWPLRTSPSLNQVNWNTHRNQKHAKMQEPGRGSDNFRQYNLIVWSQNQECNVCVFMIQELSSTTFDVSPGCPLNTLGPRQMAALL